MDGRKKIGRPSNFTSEIADSICERLVMGESLRQICKDPNMPAKASVFRWLREHTQFAEQYRLAKQLQIEDLLDETLEIADDSSGDWTERMDPDGKRYRVFNRDNVRRAKLRCDARHWLISKLMPKKYGFGE